jgi:hypothetical protein
MVPGYQHPFRVRFIGNGQEFIECGAPSQLISLIQRENPPTVQQGARGYPVESRDEDGVWQPAGRLEYLPSGQVAYIPG